MSYLVAAPDMLAVAAAQVHGIGSTLSAATTAAAAAPTIEVLAAGQDEVSAAITAVFGSYGQAYQTLSAQAAVFHTQFVQTLNAAGGGLHGGRGGQCVAVASCRTTSCWVR
jgi:hypothetical protein